MFKPSGNPKVLELTKSCQDRSCSLDALQPIALDELNIKGKPKRLCCWCAETEILKSNQKYCSKVCTNSAMATFYPQKEDALGFLLVRQDWKCLGCQFDYRCIIESILQREYEKYPNTPKISLSDLPWYYLKRLKSKVSKDRKPEIDHILAISKGGTALGLENHQVLCYTCHKAKSKIDNSGPRKKP